VPILAKNPRNASEGAGQWSVVSVPTLESCSFRSRDRPPTPFPIALGAVAEGPSVGRAGIERTAPASEPASGAVCRGQPEDAGRPGAGCCYGHRPVDRHGSELRRSRGNPALRPRRGIWWPRLLAGHERRGRARRVGMTEVRRRGVHSEFDETTDPAQKPRGMLCKAGGLPALEPTKGAYRPSADTRQHRCDAALPGT
jgi:hypothetical protein